MEHEGNEIAISQWVWRKWRKLVVRISLSMASWSLMELGCGRPGDERKYCDGDDGFFFCFSSGSTVYIIVEIKKISEMILS